MEVKNVMEELVWEMLDKVLDDINPPCRCEMCKADMVAYALNKIKPRYSSTEKGETITKAMALQFQTHMDVVAALTQAAEQVARNPRHPVDKADK